VRALSSRRHLDAVLAAADHAGSASGERRRRQASVVQLYAMLLQPTAALSAAQAAAVRSTLAFHPTLLPR
jgi:hypothetical protein